GRDGKVDGATPPCAAVPPALLPARVVSLEPAATDQPHALPARNPVRYRSRKTRSPEEASRRRIKPLHVPVEVPGDGYTIHDYPSSLVGLGPLMHPAWGSRGAVQAIHAAVIGAHDQHITPHHAGPPPAAAEGAALPALKA